MAAPRAHAPELVAEALRLLARIETEEGGQLAGDIARLARRFPGDPGAPVLEAVLTAWLEQQQQPPRPVPTRPPAGATQPELTPAAAEALKQEGIQLYGEGKVSEALDRWRRVLASHPADAEARKLLERAETVLRNQQAP